MEKKLELHNCHIITPFEEMESGNITIANGKIIDIRSAENKRSSDGRNIIDADGRITAPGFIDVHIQGAGGYDVLDGTVEGLETISKTCASFGVTSFLATTVFKKGQKNQHLKVAADTTGRVLGGAGLIGIHIEGPFIAEDKKGMIRQDSLSEPDESVLEEIYEITEGCLRMMTIAPEMKGCLNIIEKLCENNIVASFGHSLANYEQTVQGIDAGLTHVTHLFNAMKPIHQRDPGPLPAIFENKKISAQVIFDGVHIHPSVLRLTKSVIGSERIVLITDGMQAMGLPEGFYEYDNERYESRDGVAHYMDGTLIGTTLGMNSLFERFVSITASLLSEASRCSSLNPAMTLGIENSKGSIEKGKDADIVILNHDYTVWKTIKGGEIVYAA
ncbi:MAG: N-acetylglucosamine-6-phosphate deacetylase [Spirochaetota bacterium]|nr:MAG: N-acetylglucosamine-6-phosphate deacetylase [Spirochaetota bacterium]